MSLELIFLVMTLSLAPIMVSLSLLNFEEDYYDWDKSSPYECGFVGPKVPGDFSSRFFHLVILFLVWDVEIVLLIPCLQDLSVWSSGGVPLIVFMLILAYGLYYELMDGSIKWTHQK
uniref:NADH-ubiquinone oxidoreductase chain 3 n=1 Tax=Crassostrea ariakensis TaxID=3244846 RepID=D7SGR0_CRAAR|nr:NADH dehydrogenase subunit 3 [Crassostrea ariakensis]ACD35467.1 NADH dehydrogenase subunit 3 [Crassostrea ariakensis]AIM52341.1 NADH dehydrogenase subunit 3 [Crassostrea ariakensis]AIM52354.1 NADH dehydrogenase subunit 3 [Crassostrea ariakensis]AIM52367.1 NADH dehydrogenase subunit 3 [Crassostrea ariakensis]